jgi:hypothetical protein
MEARREIQALAVLPPEQIDLKATLTRRIGALTDADLSKAQAVLKALEPNGATAGDLPGVKRQLQKQVREARDTAGIEAVAQAFRAQGLIE